MDTVESVLDEVPGWHLEAKIDKTPDFSGDVSGFLRIRLWWLSYRPLIQGSVSVDLSATLEGHFGVSFAKNCAVNSMPTLITLSRSLQLTPQMAGFSAV